MAMQNLFSLTVEQFFPDTSEREKTVLRGCYCGKLGCVSASECPCVRAKLACIEGVCHCSKDKCHRMITAASLALADSLRKLMKEELVKRIKYHDGPDENDEKEEPVLASFADDDKSEEDEKEAGEK